MPYPQFDRSKLIIKSLAQRPNKLAIEKDHVEPDQVPAPLNAPAQKHMQETVVRIQTARQAGKPVIMAFGAHTIKNGLAPVLIRLMEQGWITHLATNGAGIIHDWEFAYLGQSSEDVQANVARGEFGIWQETGFYINLAIIIGTYEGLGYGESVGKLIEQEGLTIPSEETLLQEIRGSDVSEDRMAAAADLLGAIRKFKLKPGYTAIAHPFKAYSAQAAAYRLKIPLYRPSHDRTRHHLQPPHESRGGHRAFGPAGFHGLHPVHQPITRRGLSLRRIRGYVPHDLREGVVHVPKSGLAVGPAD